MNQTNSPTEHRKLRFRGNSASRRIIHEAESQVGDDLAESYACGVIEGAIGYLEASFGIEEARRCLQNTTNALLLRSADQTP